jgi:predicted transcriptional regulator of viral defense system
MKFTNLYEDNRLYFTINDISEILSITTASSKVTASRYVKKGYLIRLKRDFYITRNRFNRLNETEAFIIANILQTPSYVSFVTALSYYDISSQQQRNYIESVSLKRTKNAAVGNFIFTYSRITKTMYGGFELKQGGNNFFIALPEKALADIVYLSSMGRYKCDFDAVDFGKINTKSVNQYLKISGSKRTLLFWKKLCSNYGI